MNRRTNFYNFTFTKFRQFFPFFRFKQATCFRNNTRSNSRDICTEVTLIYNEKPTIFIRPCAAVGIHFPRQHTQTRIARNGYATLGRRRRQRQYFVNPYRHESCPIFFIFKSSIFIMHANVLFLGYRFDIILAEVVIQKCYSIIKIYYFKNMKSTDLVTNVALAGITSVMGPWAG